MEEDPFYDPMEDDFFIMQSAREGDYTLLVEALRTGEWKVEPSWRRDLFIEILEGVIRPKHRKQGTIKNLQRKAEIYMRVRELIDAGVPPTKADAKVAKEMRCSDRTVSNTRIWVDTRDMKNANWFLVLELVTELTRRRKKVGT